MRTNALRWKCRPLRARHSLRPFYVDGIAGPASLFFLLFGAFGEQVDVHQLSGVFPYTRGVRASMYTAKPWTIRQVCCASRSVRRLPGRRCLAAGMPHFFPSASPNR